MENYKYTKTWFIGNEIMFILDKFLDRTSENRILDIGCYDGLSTSFFANNFIDNSNSSSTCVDPYLSIDSNDEKSFEYNVSICKNREKIKINKITSDNFFKDNDKTFNFIYIRSYNLPDFIKRDMENSFNFLEKNGIIWMDDYKPKEEIKNVIDEFLIKYEGQYKLLHMNFQLAIMKL